jgi:hypothetical protein
LGHLLEARGFHQAISGAAFAELSEIQGNSTV